MRPGRGWRRFVRRRIIVNTTDGAGFAGLLWDARNPLVLREATILGTDGKPLPSPRPLDGEVIIDFARIAWIQIPAAAEGL